MTKYVVVTRSTFKLRYLVDAPNEEIAVAYALNFDKNANCYQKHIGEEALDVEIVSDNYDIHEESKKLGFS